MAMIACPECGKPVSNKAPTCPVCGNPINLSSGPFGGHKKAVTVRPGFWHDPNVGALGCLVIILGFLFLIVMANSGTPQ